MAKEAVTESEFAARLDALEKAFFQHIQLHPGVAHGAEGLPAPTSETEQKD